ncbi:hypothetical protein SNE40_016348 [Patella caerulea]|uniref:Sodium/glucose cotransporter 5 n=1 Tax=Patella caerulea TaxID=87958 RepID=A0AAN8P819_PATCE
MAEVLGIGDYLTIAGYFLLVLAVGLWSSCRPHRDSAAGYFLAGKDMHWIPVGCSIFASNVGAPMFIGLAGAAAASGFAVTIFEWHAVFLLIALGWLFVPVYVSSGAYTMPEFLKKRFGGRRLRIYLSALALVLYVLTKISGELYAGAIFMQQLMGWNIYLCVVLILVVTALYTITGGLTAVMYTDTLQTVILMIGATVLMIVGLIEVDGMTGLRDRYMTAAVNSTIENRTFYSCGLPRNDSFHIFRDIESGDLPWTGSVFGITILGIWVWCTDQIMVQRCLSAKDFTHAKAGSLFAAFLKITPFFLWIIPGMISRILYPDEVACASPEDCKAVCSNPAGCSNIAYPLLVIRLLPEGLRGLMLAALMAALMSSLTSIFNSASSMFTMDIWRRFRNKASENELMVVGRVAAGTCVGCSILWLPILESTQGGQLWMYLQVISSCMAPPWTVLFVLAIFWKRTTEQGAFWGLMAGLVVGMIRLVLEIYFTVPFCGSGDVDTRPLILSKVHFSHFAIIIAGVCAIVTVLVSLLTKPRPDEKLRRLTWWTRHDSAEPDISDSEDEDDENEAMTETNNDTDLTARIPPANLNQDEDNHQSPLNGSRVETIRTAKKGYQDILKNWLCGTQKDRKPKLSAEERAIIRQKMTSLSENARIRKILNGLGIILMLFTAFMFGIYF